MRMRPVFISMLLAACGGPTQQQLVETPAATAPHPHYEAPPASASDADRDRLVQQFDEMHWTQEAYKQAGPEARQRAQPAAAPKKRGPAEQATLPRPQKTTSH